MILNFSYHSQLWITHFSGGARHIRSRDAHDPTSLTTATAMVLSMQIVALVDFNINGLPVGINTTKINVYYC